MTLVVGLILRVGLAMWHDFKLLLLGHQHGQMVWAMHGIGGPAPDFCVGQKRVRVWMKHGAFGSVGVWRSACSAFEKLNEVMMTAHGIE